MRLREAGQKRVPAPPAITTAKVLPIRWTYNTSAFAWRRNGPQGERIGPPMSHQVEVFFDGACPLCTREISVLRWLDRRGRIRFTDIAASGFDPHALGKTMGDLMDRIQGRLADGRWIEGVEVFRRLYSAVGLGPLVGLSRLPGISHALDWGYRTFAKNRLKWTGRCDDHCALPEHTP